MEKKKETCIKIPHIDVGESEWCTWAGGSV